MSACWLNCDHSGVHDIVLCRPPERPGSVFSEQKYEQDVFILFFFSEPRSGQWSLNRAGQRRECGLGSVTPAYGRSPRDPRPWQPQRDPFPGNARGIRRSLATGARDARRFRRLGNMAGTVEGREPALKTGPQQGKQQEQGSAEAEEAQPVSVGRCWVCRGSVGLVLRDLAPAVPGVSSWQAQLALPVYSVSPSPIHRQGKLRDCWDVKGHYKPSLPQFWSSWWRPRSEAAHWRVSLPGSGVAL